MSALEVHKAERFPFQIFLAYIIFYAGQAVYNCYGNLFLDAHGFSQTAIGTVSSVSTVILVLVQPLWGIISDKSKSKGAVVAITMTAMGIICLAVYLSQMALWLAFCMCLFSVFFSTSVTLQDNYTLELLDNSRWNFGNIRLGGTLGYAACAAIIGFFIKNNYDNIFWMTAIFCLVSAVMMLTLPKVAGRRQKHTKVRYAVLLRDRPLLVLIAFNIFYSLSGTFGRFYSIYYQNELGATATMIGIMTTVSALSEVPFFWFAGSIEKKLGIERFMLLAATATALRLLLLFVVKDPYLVLLVQLLSGCGFANVTYCLLNYINSTVPPEMRATAQAANATLGTIFSSIIFAPIVGIIADSVGSDTVLLIGSLVMVAGILFFKLMFPRALAHQQAQGDG